MDNPGVLATCTPIPAKTVPVLWVWVFVGVGNRFLCVSVGNGFCQK
jgi:hypothetical protein